ncbi:MAG TPA: tetratricopeptide repeat protein, partial [Micromonosporaceae bacterium]
MTQGHGPAPDAEEHLATARKWLAALDLPHAAVHVAQAIAADPALAAAYVELDRMPTVDLFPLGDGAYIGNVAACAHLDARGGRWERAFALIALCLQSEPHKPWTS